MKTIYPQRLKKEIKMITEFPFSLNENTLTPQFEVETPFAVSNHMILECVSLGLGRLAASTDSKRFENESSASNSRKRVPRAYSLTRSNQV